MLVLLFTIIVCGVLVYIHFRIDDSMVFDGIAWGILFILNFFITGFAQIFILVCIFLFAYFFVSEYRAKHQKENR